MKFQCEFPLVREGAIDIDDKPFNVKKRNESKRNELLTQLQLLSTLPGSGVFGSEEDADVVAVWGEKGVVTSGTHGSSKDIPRLVSKWIDEIFEWYTRPLPKVAGDEPSDETAAIVEIEDVADEFCFTIRCRARDGDDITSFLTITEDCGI